MHDFRSTFMVSVKNVEAAPAALETLRSTLAYLRCLSSLQIKSINFLKSHECMPLYNQIQDGSWRDRNFGQATLTGSSIGLAS